MSRRSRAKAKSAPRAARARPKKLPRIGVIPDWNRPEDKPSRYEINRAYVDAVLVSQGLPLVLPYSDDPRVVSTYLASIDGLLLTGGAFDIDPGEYGQKRRPQCGPSKEVRYTFERAMLEGALQRDLPVLGICAGMQLINVVFGGSLYQDIPSDVPNAGAHEQKTDRRRPSHAVEVKAGSKLAKAVGDGQLMVNSTHHQAVCHLGEKLTPVASAPDGIIEAVEAQGSRFVMGVQWHPELLMLNVPANLGIFRALVKAASRKKS